MKTVHFLNCAFNISSAGTGHLRRGVIIKREDINSVHLDSLRYYRSKHQI